MVGRAVGAAGPLAPVEGVAVADMRDGGEVPFRRRGGDGPFQAARIPRVAHGHRVGVAVPDGDVELDEQRDQRREQQKAPNSATSSQGRNAGSNTSCVRRAMPAAPST